MILSPSTKIIKQKMPRMPDMCPATSGSVMKTPVKCSLCWTMLIMIKKDRRIVMRKPKLIFFLQMRMSFY